SLSETLDNEFSIRSLFVDYKYIYTGTYNNVIKIYDKDTQELVETLDDPEEDDVFSVFADKDYLYAGSRDNNLYVYELPKSGRKSPALSDKLYIFGGSIEDEYFDQTVRFESKIEIYNFDTNPDSREKATMLHFNDDIILIGGKNESNLADVWRLNYTEHDEVASNEESSPTPDYGFVNYRRRHDETTKHFDNEIDSTTPKENYPHSETLVADDDKRILINLSTEYLENNLTINNAELDLYLNGGSGDTVELEIAPCKTRWYPTVTWSSAPDVYDSYEFTKEVDLNNEGYVTFDISEIVKAWVSGEIKNHGLRIKKVDEENGDSVEFSSMESNTYKPEFKVKYLMEGIGTDDVEIDYDFYTSPEGVKVRTKEIGTVLGGSKKVFGMEIINSNTNSTDSLILDFKDVHEDDKIELSAEDNPFDAEELPYDMGELKPGEKKTVYIKVSPGDTSSGERTFYLTITTRVSAN
ncbi:MAG: DNRLRE domain-containing protein, partial [archaeon]